MSGGAVTDALELDDPRWSELATAYGSAGDVPGWLRALRENPSSANDAEPWFSIWSALAHQGDVYSASFAVVPHIVELAFERPEVADFSFFHFPAWVEICRARRGVEVPDFLRESYMSALDRIPSVVGVAAKATWNEDQLLCALAAIAAAKGAPVVAEAILELTSGVAEEFLEWRMKQ